MFQKSVVSEPRALSARDRGPPFLQRPAASSPSLNLKTQRQASTFPRTSFINSSGGPSLLAKSLKLAVTIFHSSLFFGYLLIAMGQGSQRLPVTLLSTRVIYSGHHWSSASGAPGPLRAPKSLVHSRFSRSLARWLSEGREDGMSLSYASGNAVLNPLLMTSAWQLCATVQWQTSLKAESVHGVE